MIAPATSAQAEGPSHRGRATLIGFVAVLLGSTLAAVTAMTRELPPLQLLATSFSMAGLVGILILGLRGRLRGALANVPIGAWALSVAGLFGYHLPIF